YVQEQDPVRRDRLLLALENYAAWRATLSDDDRRRLDAATDRAERLRLIRHLREEQFVRRLSAADRNELAALPADARAVRLLRLRERERERDRQAREEDRQVRQRQLAELTPSRLESFPTEVRVFVEKKLSPMLTDSELRRLRDAEDSWPALPRTIL